MLLFIHIVFRVALRLERLRAEDRVQKLRTLRRTRVGGFSSPFLLFKGTGGTCATSGFLLLRFFGLRQHHFGFAVGRINSEEAKHSISPSATKLLHQLFEFNVGHKANGFVNGSLDGLLINV